MKGDWNGDPSLLEAKHIKRIVADFENRTYKIFVRMEDGAIYESGTMNFTNVSSFGLLMLAARRLVRDVLIHTDWR